MAVAVVPRQREAARRESDRAWRRRCAVFAGAVAEAAAARDAARARRRYLRVVR